VRLEHSIEIRCAPEKVFAFLANPENLPQWQSGLVEVRRLSVRPGVGARHVEIRRLLGRSIEQTLEMTMYEPPRRLDLVVVDGPLRLAVSHTLAATSRGTRLNLVGEGQLSGPFRLMKSLVVALVKARGAQDLARLKELLELQRVPARGHRRPSRPR
jgi:uncharacterized protein YndB with AHSA1/START domain